MREKSEGRPVSSIGTWLLDDPRAGSKCRRRIYAQYGVQSVVSQLDSKGREGVECRARIKPYRATTRVARTEEN